MENVSFEYKGDLELFDELDDYDLNEEVMCTGLYEHGKGENAVVHLWYNYIDDYGDPSQTNIDIKVTYQLYEALKKAFEQDAFGEPGWKTLFCISEPIDP